MTFCYFLEGISAVSTYIDEILKWLSGYGGIACQCSKIKLILCWCFRQLEGWTQTTHGLPSRCVSIPIPGHVRIVQGTQCYWMSVLPFPEGVIKKIDVACHNFFWSSKHPAISWKTICKPLECGGLGLQNIQSWNKALLCKLLWNIHKKKKSLWIKWIHHYHFHGSLNTHPNQMIHRWSNRWSGLEMNCACMESQMIWSRST